MHVLNFLNSFIANITTYFHGNSGVHVVDNFVSFWGMAHSIFSLNHYEDISLVLGGPV